MVKQQSLYVLTYLRNGAYKRALEEGAVLFNADITYIPKTKYWGREEM